MPTVSIARSFAFEAAHVLEWHAGKCSRLHGHSYTVEVTVAGEIGPDGVVLDFGDVAATVEHSVISRLDHRLLNDIIENPTAENTALFIFGVLCDAGLNCTEIVLHETATSKAIVRP